ncbi:hypothetical protein K493DRAFT_319969 [Basidiobolus meristosporus CBS 931.73]|uniref:RING-type domain-containing protein n=1 Tax=Basidiobolus meristosporus CBS 931.73 TaxID=1314790 RepID=A0A1Y1XJ61_9FUNG|nr:hypothetical protein K493DRAFT_319969 [Basidiobolus meristosporus CBS 931.73]|eukprot:ORX85446.1 hypothetical protein K493DRAFT_319969 [Basidiobolus meristosporus CBS 931.73]
MEPKDDSLVVINVDSGQEPGLSDHSTTTTIRTEPAARPNPDLNRSQNIANDTQRLYASALATSTTSFPRTPSVHNAVIARRNILSHIRDSYRAISRTNRILLIITSTFSISLVTAMIVVLIVSRDKPCDRPLRVFLILYVIKFGLGIPLTLVHYLHPDGRYPQYSSNVWVQWTDRMKSLLDFLGVFFFIMGNYFLFTSNTCERTAPSLFGMSLAMIIMGYFMVAIPVLLCATAVFCLPCVLVVLRALHIGPDSNTGAKPEEIKSIALLRYRHGGPTQCSIANNQHPNISSVGFSQKFAFLRKLRLRFGQKKKHHVDDFVDKNEISNLPEFRVADPEDAVCVICLEEYGDGDLVRKLHCNHHFHQPCLDEWLLINKFCPLCKASVLQGKNETSEEP